MVHTTAAQVVRSFEGRPAHSPRISTSQRLVRAGPRARGFWAAMCRCAEGSAGCGCDMTRELHVPAIHSRFSGLRKNTSETARGVSIADRKSPYPWETDTRGSDRHLNAAQGALCAVRAGAPLAGPQRSAGLPGTIGRPRSDAAIPCRGRRGPPTHSRATVDDECPRGFPRAPNLHEATAGPRCPDSPHGVGWFPSRDTMVRDGESPATPDGDGS
jgi:hypothetical protein